ncbi:MAG: FkbM family methyltransferase [Candidatus Omnitrophota bacterium]|nr:MAG: FkbM family methyltransferase [Candidatus Omnitrophota bacterium]
MRYQDFLIEYIKHSKDFFFVEIGAHDGAETKTGGKDSLYDLIKRFNLKGILVEPQKYVFEDLEKNYAEQSHNLIFENVAIAEKNGKKKLYKLYKEPWEKDEHGRELTEHSSLLPIRSGLRYPYFEIVDCMTFNDLVGKYNVKKIDLLQIDTEGYDYKIIKSINFKKIRPFIISYEHIHLSGADRVRCKKFLQKQGYEVFILEDNNTCCILSDKLKN